MYVGAAPTGPPSTLDRPKRRRFRSVPSWVPIVIVLAAAPFLTFGVLGVANFIQEHTTVSLGYVSWEMNVSGAPEYLVSCQQQSCPQHAAPGSDYTSTIFVSGYFAGKNVTLSAPSPFRLLSTIPTLPALVPGAGLTITVVLGLPSTAGDYNCLGLVAFS